jgi:hypothetical protein
VRRRAALAVLAAAALAGCGGGPRVTETRPVAPFDALEVADSVDVEVVPGDGSEVRVHAGEDVLDRVHTESAGGVLRIDLKDRGIVIGPDPLGDVRVQLAVSGLERVTVEGSGDVQMSGLSAEALELEIEGAGEIEAAGSVDRLTATIEGAGDADLFDLAVRTADVTVEGAGDAALSVSERLDVRVQGAGDVTYRGDPAVSSSIEGAGDLSRERP